ncbi:hypothetical protein [Paenibacillus sp. FSL H3-0333]|uniref:hypothetical protein n=1 Tax=Paenibacillus sp. FSL H3-0333 TaxID=2921373 RepID=UPI0030F8B092
MTVIYKVEQIDYMGYPAYERYFNDKNNAEQDFEDRLLYIKETEDIVEPEEHDEKNEFLLGDKNKIKAETVWYWERSSYEYEEYDRYPIELNLREIELN